MTQEEQNFKRAIEIMAREKITFTGTGTGRIRAALVLIGECLACAAIFGTAWLFMLIGYGMGLH